MGPPGAVASAGALTMPTPNRFATQRTSVRFVNPTGMKVAWYAPGADGRTGFSANQLEVPGRYNFVQAAIYRLKLTDVPGRPNLELYPTLEVVPSNLRSNAFLAHSSVPVSFTEEDLEQVIAGNYVVKVIYLPDPQFQDLAATGTDEVVSSRLEPGVDPIAEAYRRGSILLIVRLGNIDLEAPNTPAMDAPSRNPMRMGQGAPMPGMPTAPMPHQMGMGGQPGMPPVGLPPGMPMPAAPEMPNGPGSMAPTQVPGITGQPMPPQDLPTRDGGPTAAPASGEVGQVIYTEANDGTPVERPSRRAKRWAFQNWFHSKEPAKEPSSP